LGIRSCLKKCGGSAEERRTRNGKKQIPFGNDRKKGNSNSNSNGRSRFPSGMTERKATATAKARMQGSLPLRRQKTPPPVERTDSSFRQVLRG